MFLSDVSIRRPVFTAMMSLALIVFGLLAYRGLAVDQFPPVDFPIMVVRTIYPGAAPEDIERDVTEPLEDSLASVAGLDQIQSYTRDSASVIVLQFAMGTDLTDAVSLVRDKVGAVQGELPPAVEDPVIQQIDIGALPVMVIALSSPQGVNQTRDLADERLRPFLEQVNGVGAVNVLGGQDREIQVDLNLDALASMGITPMQVAERIGYENLSLPVGQYDQHGFTVGIRAEGQYESVDDLRDTVVHLEADGRQVRLREVANVVDDWSRADRYVRFNRQDAVSLEIVKRSGANTVEVAEGIRHTLAEVVPTLGEGVEYAIISDQSHDIEANAHEVWVAIFVGGAAAIGVIWFFLLDARGTMISALALPTAVIGTFAAMGLAGFSLNTMTLLGLSLAIGLLIDDAVVVRESITRRLELGDSPEEAASRGTKEIALAVLATTLSLVAVFVPVAFMSGIVGQFFKQFGLTISIAVLLSLFVAFTLDPMLSARLSKAHDPHHKRTGIPGLIERFLDRLDHRYRGMLDWSLRWRKTTVFLAIASLFVAGAAGSQLKAEFMVVEDRGEFLADMRLPIGTSLDETEKWSRRMETTILGIPGVEYVYTVVGHESQDNRARFRVRVVPKDQREEPLHFYQDAVRSVLATAPSSEVNISEPGLIDGLGDWPPIMVVIQGAEMDVLTAEADRVQALLKGIPGTRDVRLSTNPGRPELHIDIDRDLAADRFVPAGLVASTARMLVEGQVVGSLRDEGKTEADIRVRAAPRFADDPQAIAALPLPSPRGVVTLGDVAHVRMGAGPSEIQHTDRMRSITVHAHITPDGSLGAVLEAFHAGMQQKPLPPGYFYNIEGQAQDMEETSAAMGIAVLTAFVFIFMVLASQFESLLHPFTLLVSVPLAMVGAVLALWIGGFSISMGSQIGMILLMGLVTKNAILLVDGALSNMRDGMDKVEAMRNAGPRRLRPILMTSAAMVFGMIPTAIGTGVGAEFRAPMAVAVIGGVISSTLLTLLVVPVVFLWMERVRELLAAAWAWVNGSGVGSTPASADGLEPQPVAK